MNRNEAFINNLDEFLVSIKQLGKRDENQFCDYLNKYYENEGLGDSLRNEDKEAILNFISCLSKQSEDSLYFRF